MPYQNISATVVGGKGMRILNIYKSHIQEKLIFVIKENDVLCEKSTVLDTEIEMKVFVPRLTPVEVYLIGAVKNLKCSYPVTVITHQEEIPDIDMLNELYSHPYSEKVEARNRQRFQAYFAHQRDIFNAMQGAEKTSVGYQQLAKDFHECSRKITEIMVDHDAMIKQQTNWKPYIKSGALAVGFFALATAATQADVVADYLFGDCTRSHGL